MTLTKTRLEDDEETPPGWDDLEDSCDLEAAGDLAPTYTTVVHVRITHSKPIAELDMLVAGSVHNLEGIGSLLVVESEQFVDGEKVSASLMRF